MTSLPDPEDFVEMLGEKLIIKDQDKLSEVDTKARLDKKWVCLYFSAHWVRTHAGLCSVSVSAEGWITCSLCSRMHRHREGPLPLTLCCTHLINSYTMPDMPGLPGAHCSAHPAAPSHQSSRSSTCTAKPTTCEWLPPRLWAPAAPKTLCRAQAQVPHAHALTCVAALDGFNPYWPLHTLYTPHHGAPAHSHPAPHHHTCMGWRVTHE